MEGLTACTLDCPDTCSIIVSHGNSGSIRLTGNPDHPVTAGFTCNKIRRWTRQLCSPNRITQPLLRSSDGWRPVSWEEALGICAARLDKYRQEPASVLHVHGEGAKGVLKHASKLFFARFGSSRLSGSLCDAAGFVACLMDFGSRDNNDIELLPAARRIVNWGKDLSRSSVHTAAAVRKARKQGCQVLTISPGGDGNESFSDHIIRIHPGTDRFLAAAVLRRIIEQYGIPEALSSRARGWDLFRELLLSQSQQSFADRCGVRQDDINAIFESYNSGEPVSTLIGAGLQRYAFGGENVRFINALAMLSGNVGRPGAGVYFHMHSLGNFNMGWAADHERKPRRSFPMPLIGESIARATDPPVRMVWVNGSNFVNQAPDSLATARAFEDIEFKVVVDAFMTDTALRADLFLPCKLMLEQEDLAGSYLHEYIHYVPALLKAPGEARTDYEILSELGKRLKSPILLPEPDECFRAALDSPSLNVSLEELRTRGFVRATKPAVAYERGVSAHPDQLYHLPTAIHDEDPAPDGYPLRLLTLIRRDYVHSQFPPEDQVIPPVVSVSPDSLSKYGISGDRVFLASQLGRVKVNVKADPSLPSDVVVYRRGDWMSLGGGPNRIIEARLTDVGNGAPYYQQYVRIENE